MTTESSTLWLKGPHAAVVVMCFIWWGASASSIIILPSMNWVLFVEVPLFPTTFRIFNRRKMKKIAVNKYTYFASCIDFFQAPKGQGKIQVMSKMSWCIMLNYQIRGFIFPLVCLFFLFFVYFKVNFSWVFEIYPAPSCWGWNVSLITDYPSPMGIGKSLHVVDSLIISIS